jgi:hypothetical protein
MNKMILNSHKWFGNGTLKGVMVVVGLLSGKCRRDRTAGPGPNALRKCRNALSATG